MWRVLFAVVMFGAIGVVAIGRQVGGGSVASAVNAQSSGHGASYPPAPIPQDCRPAPAFDAAAAQNGVSLTSATWSAFGRPELGWEVYAPLTAHEIASVCPPQSSGFAQALAAWQRAHGVSPNGVMDEPTLKALKQVWMRRRPFVLAMAKGSCPAPASPDQLAWIAAGEGYSGKPAQLQTQALTAYRAMIAAVRAEAPEAAADHRLLTIFSGYREPLADLVSCEASGVCGTIERARCSAHRTGMAVDLYLGAAPGFSPDSTADQNRLWQSHTPIYRWLVANAGRFGFVSYPFEPWHWEWTGAPP